MATSNASGSGNGAAFDWCRIRTNCSMPVTQLAPPCTLNRLERCMQLWLAASCLGCCLRQASSAARIQHVANAAQYRQSNHIPQSPVYSLWCVYSILITSTTCWHSLHKRIIPMHLLFPLCLLLFLYLSLFSCIPVFFTVLLSIFHVMQTWNILFAHFASNRHKEGWRERYHIGCS